MGKKRIISQAMLWAAAILVVALGNDKQTTTLLLTVLATVAILSLQQPKL